MRAAYLDRPLGYCDSSEIFRVASGAVEVEVEAFCAAPEAVLLLDIETADIDAEGLAPAS